MPVWVRVRVCVGIGVGVGVCVDVCALLTTHGRLLWAVASLAPIRVLWRLLPHLQPTLAT